MTGRFLFIAALYQGLFYLADLRSNPSHSFLKACGRLLCGLVCLMLCFLISTGLIAPSQIKLCYLQLFYGGVTLYLHFLGREQLELYDFLILTYGLSFFMLPKISPLDFIHAFMGSSALTLLYIYISAFWLDLQQWCLSSIFLLFVTVLFMYISYSAERSSRERWLLRERLSQEHIDLHIVLSTLQEDMEARNKGEGARGEVDDIMHGVYSGRDDGKIEEAYDSGSDGVASVGLGGTVDRSIRRNASSSFSQQQQQQQRRRGASRRRPLPHINTSTTSSSSSSTRGSAKDGLGGGSLRSRRPAPAPIDSEELFGGGAAESDGDGDGDSESGAEGGRGGEPSKKQRIHMFFRGLLAWALCMCMGYAFQMIADADGSDAVRAPSKSFALLMHSMGFSVFLLYFTGQMRWLVVNGFVGIVLLLIFNESGIDNRWAVISTHSVGYFILAVVVVASILVFGGVVLVWSHLIDFVKNIISRYPEVTVHIRRDNKVLERVLLSYLAEMPSLSPLNITSSSSSSSSSSSYYCSNSDGGGGDEEAGIVASGKAQAAGGAPSAVTGNAHISKAGSIASTALTQQQQRRPSVGNASRGAGFKYSSSADDVTSTSSASAQLQLPRRLTPLLESRRGPNTCYFCLKDGTACMLPACAGWAPRAEDGDGGGKGGIPMCTPYTELVRSRDEVSQLLEETRVELDQAHNKITLLTDAVSRAEASAEEARAEARLGREALASARQEAERGLRVQAAAHEEAVQRLISGFNGQVTQMKRLYKAMRRAWNSGNTRAGGGESRAAEEEGGEGGGCSNSNRAQRHVQQETTPAVAVVKSVGAFNDARGVGGGGSRAFPDQPRTANSNNSSSSSSGHSCGTARLVHSSVPHSPSSPDKAHERGATPPLLLPQDSPGGSPSSSASSTASSNANGDGNCDGSSSGNNDMSVGVSLETAGGARRGLEEDDGGDHDDMELDFDRYVLNLFIVMDLMHICMYSYTYFHTYFAQALGGIYAGGAEAHRGNVVVFIFLLFILISVHTTTAAAVLAVAVLAVGWGVVAQDGGSE